MVIRVLRSRKSSFILLRDTCLVTQSSFLGTILFSCDDPEYTSVICLESPLFCGMCSTVTTGLLAFFGYSVIFLLLLLLLQCMCLGFWVLKFKTTFLKSRFLPACEADQSVTVGHSALKFWYIFEAVGALFLASCMPLIVLMYQYSLLSILTYDKCLLELSIWLPCSRISSPVGGGVPWFKVS